MSAESRTEKGGGSPRTSPEPKPIESLNPHRLFLHEQGWRVSLKIGSERTFCYMMAPGQDFYHRLLDGEIYIHQQDERLCIACAERRGLLSYEAKGLRPVDFDSDVEPGPDDSRSEIKLIDPEEEDEFA